MELATRDADEMLNNNSRNQYEWSSLPKELLDIIAQKLDSRIDVLRFRAVCTCWRSALSPTHLTFRLSILSSHIHICAPRSTFIPFTICCMQLSTVSFVPKCYPSNTNNSFLVKVVELASGKLKLLDPLSSSSKIYNLLYLSNNSKTFNLLDFRLIELYKGYDFEFKCKGNDHFEKTLFSDDCTAVGIYSKGKLGFWSLTGDVCTNPGSEGTHYDDIILYKGQFYVIDRLGVVSWINQSMNLVPYTPPLCGYGQLKNLIESDGKLYVIDSYIDLDLWLMPQWKDEEVYRVDRDCARVDMKVYVLDEEWGTWVLVESLGNQSFCIG